MTFCFCFSLDLAAEALLAMMRFARFGSTLASGAGARWRPPLPLRLGGDTGSSSCRISAAQLEILQVSVCMHKTGCHGVLWWS